MQKDSNNIPLSLYVHIPWCEKKCPYCDFNSHEIRETIPEADYFERLLIDLDQELKFCQDRPIESVFIGGGTPNSMKAESISLFVEELKRRCEFKDNIEITMEANPGASSQDYFNELGTGLINRISLGIQSFQDEKLKSLGRIHSANQAIEAAEAVKKNFNNFNIDLMFKLPNQSINDTVSDLETAIRLNPSHLSWYQLTIEPNTVFYSRRPKLPSLTLAEDIYATGYQLLEDRGYLQYEISAYAPHKNRCEHNQNYWRFGDYIGIGAGAHGKLSRYNSEGKLEILRSQKTRKPSDYLTSDISQIGTNNKVKAQDYALEFFMNHLRLNEPIPLDLYKSSTGITIFEDKDTMDALQRSQELGLIEIDNDFIRKTQLGSAHLDTLLENFVSD